MVLLNGKPVRVTLEEVLDVLDVFDNTTPCWLTDDLVTLITAALIDRLVTTGTKGPLANAAWDSGRWVN